MIRRSLLIVSVAFLSLGSFCGDGKPEVPETAEVGTPAGEGVVKSLKGKTEKLEVAEPGFGELVLDVQHTDRAVNRKIKVTVRKGGTAEEVAKGEGNTPWKLPPGTYDFELVYDESELAKGFTGSAKGVTVTYGWRSKYTVNLAAPIGQLKLKFGTKKGETAAPEPVNDRVRLEVFKAEVDPDHAGPIWQGPAGEGVILPAGKYQVKATFDDGEGQVTTEWYRDIELGEAMAKTERDIVFDLAFSGMRVDAFNFGRDVNGETRVYFFANGADVKVATAKAQGQAGTIVPVEPGIYDVLIQYAPTNGADGLVGEHVLKSVEIIHGGGRRLQLDLQKATATVRLGITLNNEDVAERVEMQVIRNGADPDASTPVLDASGVGTHAIPAGKYDIYLTYRDPTASTSKRPPKKAFKGLDFCNGCIWEQKFDGAIDGWEPTAMRIPTQSLRPVDFRDSAAEKPGDDDSAADATPSTPTPAAAATPGAASTPAATPTPAPAGTPPAPAKP